MKDQAPPENEPTPTENKPNNIHKRGFASTTPDQQRRIASKGGRAAHKLGVAHRWTANEAREAGKKGGQISGINRNKSQNDEGASQRKENAE